MLQACKTGSEVLTIARWESLEAWENFWGTNNPKQMQAMREFGQRISAEVFNEIGDFSR
jgi:heme-degrading monooxygenase HmoA